MGRGCGNHSKPEVVLVADRNLAALKQKLDAEFLNGFETRNMPEAGP
jgi:hypothetical protein